MGGFFHATNSISLFNIPGQLPSISLKDFVYCVSVLKVAHHGSSTSTSSNFLDLVKPQIAAISVGAENTFGHPDENTLTRLKTFVGSDNIYRTDKSGTIEFTTDGQQLWIKTDR